MTLDKSHPYVFRIGSDNQHRLYWDGKTWHYEFVAGGVLFDEQSTPQEDELENIVSVHGLSLDQFEKDDGAAAVFAEQTRAQQAKLAAKGLMPCPKHGMTAKNDDDSCEGCLNPDFWDEHKGTEG